MSSSVQNIPVIAAHQACNDAVSDVLVAHADSLSPVELFGILANACGWYSLLCELDGCQGQDVSEALVQNYNAGRAGAAEKAATTSQGRVL